MVKCAFFVRWDFFFYVAVRRHRFFFQCIFHRRLDIGPPGAYYTNGQLNTVFETKLKRIFSLKIIFLMPIFFDDTHKIFKLF